MLISCLKQCQSLSPPFATRTCVLLNCYYTLVYSTCNARIYFFFCNTDISISCLYVVIYNVAIYYSHIQCYHIWSYTMIPNMVIYNDQQTIFGHTQCSTSHIWYVYNVAIDGHIQCSIYEFPCWQGINDSSFIQSA